MIVGVRLHVYLDGVEKRREEGKIRYKSSHASSGLLSEGAVTVTRLPKVELHRYCRITTGSNNNDTSCLKLLEAIANVSSSSPLESNLGQNRPNADLLAFRFPKYHSPPTKLYSK